MPTDDKIARVEELTAIISEAKVIYLADFTGIDVASVTDLRRKLRAASVDYQVVKNRLAKRAAEAAGFAQMKDFLTGPTAIAFTKEDPVLPAKILQEFIDNGGKLAIKMGLLEGRLLSEEQFRQMAKLPSREQLLGKVVGGIQAPIYGLAIVLNALLRNLVGVVAAIEEKRREEGGKGSSDSAQVV